MPSTDDIDAERRDIHSADIPVLCRACEARHRGICGALHSDELVQLGRQTHRHEFEPGTTLVAAGEAPERYSNILSGAVKLSKLLSDGRQQVVELQFAPDFIGRPYSGESSVLVEAAGRVRLCSFPKAALERMIRLSPALENRLYRQALRQLDDARDWMMTLGRKNAEEKVASFLVMLSHHMHPDRAAPTTSFELPLARSDIADFLGLTIETVSRKLTALRKAGVIDIEKARIVTIRDADRLGAAMGGP